MTSLEEDEFIQAKRILTNMDEITNPAKRIHAFDTGVRKHFILFHYFNQGAVLDNESYFWMARCGRVG
jgi:hypothetical protein